MRAARRQTSCESWESLQFRFGVPAAAAVVEVAVEVAVNGIRKRAAAAAARYRPLPLPLPLSNPLPPAVRRASRCGAAGVQVVPVQDRVETDREGALRLPAPERANAEHHNVTLTNRRIDDL